MAFNEKGPWKVVQYTERKKQKLYIQSDDFTHDVALKIDGDFGTYEEKLEYAEELARRLSSVCA